VPVFNGLLGAIRVHRPGIFVVGENNSRTYENAIAKFGWFIYLRIILYFAVFPYPHTRSHVDIPADNAVFSQDNSLANVGERPNLGTFRNHDAGMDYR
jgi:hypothetical protein